MNMYLHELKFLRKNTLIWTCALIALAALYMSIFPGIVKDAKDFEKLIMGYPAPLRAMLGINIDFLTSIVGYYSMTFSFVVLFGAIQAMNMGMSILSKESRERTADFLLVKPVSRKVIVSAKLLAATTALIATNIIYISSAFLMAEMVKNSDYNMKQFFLINLTFFFVQVIFLSIGLIISVFFNKLRNVLPISLGTVIGLYIIGALLATKSDDAARYLSPFKYFDTSYIIKHETFETPFVIMSVVIVLAAIIASFVIYVKKDIHAVS